MVNKKIRLFFILTILLKYSDCQLNVVRLKEVEINYANNNLTNRTDFTIKLPLDVNSLEFSNVWVGLGFNNARQMVNFYLCR